MAISVSYSRVSTLLEQQQRSLIEQQEQWGEIIEKEGDTLAYCGVFYKKNGTKKPKKGMYVDEGISGKDYTHRLAFLQMVQDGMNKKFQKIYVEDCSRFARCTEDGMKIIKDLREKNVNVYFRKEAINSIDPNNDLVLTVLFASAEKENQMRSERFKWRFERLHKKGGWSCPAPYGYNVKETVLSINEKEATIVDLIFYLYTEIGLGMRKIANYLNENGFRTRKGNLWQPNGIHNVLNNELVIGIIRNHKTESFDITRGTKKKIPEDEQIVYKDEKLRIISDKMWNKKEKIIKERNKNFKDGHGYSSNHLLSTLLYCENCGSTYFRTKRRERIKKDGSVVGGDYEWSCLAHNHYGNIKCPCRYPVNEEKIIEFIKKELKQRQQQDTSYLLDLYRKRKLSEIKNINIDKLSEEKKEINNQIIELRREKNRKIINEETYSEQVKELNRRNSIITGQIKHYDNIQQDIKDTEIQYEEYCKMLNNIDFNKLTNQSLKKIFNKIKIAGVAYNGIKKVNVHFGYKFLDELEIELKREETDNSMTEIYKQFSQMDMNGRNYSYLF